MTEKQEGIVSWISIEYEKLAKDYEAVNAERIQLKYGVTALEAERDELDNTLNGMEDYDPPCFLGQLKVALGGESTPKCALCGSLDIIIERDFRCGGAVGCICPNCVNIVTRWEEAKKKRCAWWRSVIAERRASEFALRR